MPYNHRESSTAPVNPPIQIGNTTYDFVSPLSGRGQAGRAGFYSADGGQHVKLIKEDDPGTCLAEGLVIIFNPLPQTPMPDPIIQATAGVVMRDGVSTTVSMQDRYSPVPGDVIMPFDQYILGHKRDPKTILSEECRQSSAIKEKIRCLPNDVKIQLAYAIYTSQLNGDESLHTGQFMISVNKETQLVSSIRRIDFGALGRYGLARVQFDPLHTSKQYAGSGQFGKDYVSYLLQDNDVKQQVLKLWANTNTDAVVDAVSKRFSEQLAGLEGPSKEHALKEFDRALTKKSTTTLDSEGNIQAQVLVHLVQATTARCDGMNASAIRYLDNPKNVGTHHYLKDKFQKFRSSSQSSATTTESLSSNHTDDSKEKVPSHFTLRNL